ncbi:MAG: tsf, partial [Rhizobacter sp.]|nr:tsf [Rhizobacter sp.]
MAAITATMVAALRAKTDAPMMECKRALTDAEGDMDRAEELLRVKLGSKASKAASRVTSEGIVAIYIDGKTGSIIELNCETDFVAKNDDFLAFGTSLAKLIAAQNPADVAALGTLDLEGTPDETTLTKLIGKLGENVSIRRFKRFAGHQLVSDLHGTRIGVVVEFDGDVVAAKDVAMHVAAMKPVSLSSSDVPADLIEKERRVSSQKA